MGELVVDDPYLLRETVRLPLADETEADRTLDAARQAARAFATSTIADRVELCRRALDSMLARRETIAGDITRMMGKPLAQARRELDTMAERARHVMSIAADSLADEPIPGRPGFERRIERVPLGVVLDMPAWNYPLLTCVNAAFPAVLAGNAVILKHSSRSPLCGEHFASAFAAAGAPEGLFQAIHCDHRTAARIASDARVDHVAFTGSVTGGRAIHAAVAARRFIDVGLELGGKDAAYLAEDADLAAAAAALVDGACYNAGQSCCGVERVFVHRSLYRPFVDAALAEMEKLTMGDPRTEVTVGPMAQPNAPAFLERQVRDAEENGARLLIGGRPTRVDGHGRFFPPTLLVEVNPSAEVMRVESFGPIMPVTPVDSDEQAIALINDSDLGLTASIWTRDLDRAALLARRLEVGTVYLNTCDVLDPALPWTGVKDSGKGSTLGRLGFLQLTRPRSILFRLPS